MLLVLLNLSLILQSIPPPTNYTDYGWVPYGFAALVAGQLFQIIRWIMKKDERTAERRAEAAAINLEALYKREERLATERSEKYREDNRIRDDKYIKSMEANTKVLEKISGDGNKFIDATKDMVEKFVQLVNKVMDQSNYQTETLIELKSMVSILPGEFENLKKDINDHLEKLTYRYELIRKDQ